MDNTYSNSYASLHTVKHDTTILDAQKILIKTPEDSVASRTDLIDYIKQESDKASNLTNKLADSLNVYLNRQVYKSPSPGGGGIGGANILVVPANIFDPSLIYTHVMFQGSFADGYSDPIYLGMLLWDAEGKKTIAGVSEAFIPGSVEGNVIQFSFSKTPFTVPADNRIIFYFLKSSEDIALDYPNYDSPRPRIKVSANKAIYDPYGRWNDAQTDINLGFHCDGQFNSGSAWDSWPIFSLVVDLHHFNGSHLTAEHLQKLNNLDSEKIDIDINSVKTLVERQTSDIDNLESLVEKQADDIDNIETMIKGEAIEKTFNSNFINGTPDGATVIGIQYGSEHFVKNGEINSISIPYSDRSNTRPTGYLVAELYDKDESLISRYYSEDPFTYNASNTTATFEFKNFKVPQTYKFIRFALVADKTTIPDFSDSNICKEFRCKPIGIDTNNDGRLEFDNFDNDDCQIFATGGSASNWLVDINVNYTQYEGGLINEVKENKNRLDIDIFNANTEITRIDNSLTEAYNILNNAINEIKAESDAHLTLEEANELFAAKGENDGNYAVINAENTFSESNTFTKDITVQNTLYSLDSQNQTSSSATVLASKSINVGRESLNSEELHNIKNIVLGHNEVIVSNMEGSGAIGQVVAARLANPFFASGTISNVRIFHNINHTGLFDNDPRYLYLNVDGTVYRSEAVIWDGPVSYTDFKFNNIVIPEDYALVDILMSKNGALENPSYTNRTGSVNFSSSITYAADTYGNSRVRIYQGGEAEIAQSAIIKVEVTTGTTTGDNILSTINTAVHGTVTEGLIYNTNTVNGTLDNATIKGIQYSKNHFVSDAHVTSIAIPYNYQSGAGNSGYLYVEIVNEDGNIISSAYSVESASFNDSSSGEHTATFNFSNFYIPENYRVVRLALVSAKTIKPNIVSTEDCLSFRARPIKLNNNVNYDEDDCQIFASATSTQNWLIQLRVTYTQVNGGVTDDILYNDIRVNKLIKDVSNLVSLSESHISKEEAQSSFANKAITETTLSETGYICELATDATGDCECDAIHYAANKIPHNILIDEIRIPVLNDSPKPLYLAVWIVSQTDAKTYIGLSDSTATWSAGGTAIWKFTNNPINVPENYRLELFLAEAAPASGASQVPASTNYIKAFTDYSGGGTARYADRWYSGRDIRTVFVKNGIVVEHDERIAALLRRIEQLEQRITELEERGISRLRRS